MLRKDSPVFSEFGEIYFSCTYPGAIKAWHLHKEMTLNYAVIHGSIKCVLFDDRPDSKTRGCVEEYFLSPENYSLITVPPLVWNGWKGIGNETSIVANCATIPHDPSEIERKPVIDPSIPYDWEIEHK
jgi:dTDP-4-dehydrorhamnose 3,5-epimerase